MTIMYMVHLHYLYLALVVIFGYLVVYYLYQNKMTILEGIGHEMTDTGPNPSPNPSKFSIDVHPSTYLYSYP
jgi:hypothetical protein